MIDVAESAAVGEGELLGVTLPSGSPVCLFRHRGVLGAVADHCTHAEFNMSDGILRADGTIECVWHGARFDCRSGEAVRGPAVDPLAVYAVREQDGRVLVEECT